MFVRTRFTKLFSLVFLWVTLNGSVSSAEPLPLASVTQMAYDVATRLGLPTDPTSINWICGVLLGAGISKLATTGASAFNIKLFKKAGRAMDIVQDHLLLSEKDGADLADFSKSLKRCGNYYNLLVLGVVGGGAVTASLLGSKALHRNLMETHGTDFKGYEARVRADDQRVVEAAEDEVLSHLTVKLVPDLVGVFAEHRGGFLKNIVDGALYKALSPGDQKKMLSKMQDRLSDEKLKDRLTRLLQYNWPLIVRMVTPASEKPYDFFASQIARAQQGEEKGRLGALDDLIEDLARETVCGLVGKEELPSSAYQSEINSFTKQAFHEGIRKALLNN